MIKGRNPGPGFLIVPGPSLIPPTAKQIPTANQNKLPMTSVPIRFIIISGCLESGPAHPLSISFHPTGKYLTVNPRSELNRGLSRRDERSCESL